MSGRDVVRGLEGAVFIHVGCPVAQGSRLGLVDETPLLRLTSLVKAGCSQVETHTAR